MNKILFVLSCVFVSTLSAEGSIQTVGHLLPSAQCHVSSQVTGKIDKVEVVVGDKVTKDQPLLSIDKNLLEIDVAQNQSLLRSAQLELTNTDLNYQRMLKLWEKPEGTTPSISQKMFEEAKFRYDQAKTRFDNAQVNLKRAEYMLTEASIKAPFSGIVSMRFVDVGEMISGMAHTHLLEIQAIDELYLEFSVPQSYLSKVIKGTPITFEVEGSNVSNCNAIIHQIYPSIDEHTRSFKCRCIIDNQDHHLSPGSMAKVEINFHPNFPKNEDAISIGF